MQRSERAKTGIGRKVAHRPIGIATADHDSAGTAAPLATAVLGAGKPHRWRPQVVNQQLLWVIRAVPGSIDEKGESLLYHTPLIKSIYPALRDFLNYFSPERRKDFDQVVAVTLGDTGIQVIGFVTQANQNLMPKDFRDEDSVLVYLPLSYMIGGYTALIPRSAVRPVDMNMEAAMRFTLTAGVTGSEDPREQSAGRRS